jgi:hypothetical protein
MRLSSNKFRIDGMQFAAHDLQMLHGCLRMFID